MAIKLVSLEYYLSKLASERSLQLQPSGPSHTPVTSNVTLRAVFDSDTDGLTFPQALLFFQKLLVNHRYDTVSLSNRSHGAGNVQLNYILPVQEVLNGVFLRVKAPKLQHLVLRDTMTSGVESCTILFGLNLSDEGKNWISRPFRMQGNYTHSTVLFDEEVERKAICRIVFVAPGTLTAEQLTISPAHELTVSESTARLMTEVVSANEKNFAPFGLITDQTTSLLLYTRQPHQKERWLIKILPTNEYPITMVIGAIVHDELYLMRLARDTTQKLVSGMLAAVPATRLIEGPDRQLKHPDAPEVIGLTDWNWGEFEFWTSRSQEFSHWRKKMRDEMANCRPYLNTVLKFVPRGFERTHLLRRPRIPAPFPPEVDFSVNLRKRRKMENFDAIIGQSGPILFQVVAEPVKTGSEGRFSHVLKGTIGGYPETLCLKLYDERKFPVDLPLGQEPTKAPGHNLLTGISNFSELENRSHNVDFVLDVITREEAAYDQLKVFQGAMLPYCYGVHLFALPDGSKMYGMLLEYIDGDTVDQSAVLNWSKDKQEKLVSSLSSAVQVLDAYGIHKREWKSRHILCRHTPNQTAGMSGRSTNETKQYLHEVVLVGFGTAAQRFDRFNDPIPPSSTDSLRDILREAGIPQELLSEIQVDDSVDFDLNDVDDD
ncbi:hypothetical protein OBBRIDRAFT_829750 [Obba rivulosa]|uniref:Protein kinase domain-containing protein n=1 Tax=Obba rivulosa TaxID=1052685 RepID=A0A8E2AL64_9APHY|nr:hypothetical protein OBBRIDRAFT_829750 [Obba rivulosa]